MGRYQEASDQFKYVIEKLSRDDSFSFIALATIALKNAFNCKEYGSGEQDKLLVKAYNKYLDILAHDQGNTYACMGLANVLAFFNKTEDAQEIYKLVCQANPSMYSPILNQAHLCVGDKKYELAINLYDIVLDKYIPQDLKTGMYLAKAYFLKDNFEVCKKVLIKLITRNPHEMTLKFNLALCLFSQAQRIIYSDMRRSNQTRESMTYLRQSQRLFAWL